VLVLYHGFKGHKVRTADALMRLMTAEEYWFMISGQNDCFCAWKKGLGVMRAKIIRKGRV